MNRLKTMYQDKIIKELMTELELENVMEAPKLRKMVLNAGIGEFRDNREALDSFIEEFKMFAGQLPNPRKARLSEAGFKIRKGDTVGYSVTLRGERMWAFLDKLINIVLPRVRDFKGLNMKSFDGAGNYTFGVEEHVIFPEVDPNKTKGSRGLEITFVIESKSKEHSHLLLEKLGLPFDKKTVKENKERKKI